MHTPVSMGFTDGTRARGARRWSWRPASLLAAASLALGGCSKMPEKVIPCVTNVDSVSLNYAEDLHTFIDMAIPIGSNPECADNVLSGESISQSDKFLDKKDESVSYVYWE